MIFRFMKSITSRLAANQKNMSGASVNRIAKIIAIMIFLSSFMTLAFLASVSPRGFDITDEGFHLLASQFPMEVIIWPNVAHIYTGLMFNIAGQNIAALRILSEVLIFLSASLFFSGLSRLVLAIYPATIVTTSFKMIAWSMMCLGALFYYIHFDTTPSYNSLNAIFVYAAAGFLCHSLASMSSCTPGYKLAALYSFAGGLFIGMTLMVKFPTALSLTLLFIFTLISWPNIRWNDRLLNICMLSMGIITWIILHIALLQSFSSLWHTLYFGVTTFLSFGLHKPSHMIQHYIPELIHLITNAAINFWKIYLILLVGLIVSCLAYKKKDRLATLAPAYLITLCILTGWWSFTLNFHKGGASNSIHLMEIYTSWLLFFIIATVVTVTHKSIWTYIKNIYVRRFILLSGFLFMLPFAGAAGTANVITLNLTQYMAAWFGLMLLLMLFLTYAHNNRWIFLTGSIIITSFACSQIVSAGFIDPYGLNTGIQRQTIATAIGIPATNMKLDQASSQFFIQIKQIANRHGFKPGDDIFAFSDMSGIVFALGGKSPVVPLYSDLPHAKLINEWLVQQTSLQRLKNAFILLNTNGGKNMPDQMKLAIKFPSDYVFCGKLQWPRTGEWVSLWKPKQHV